MQYFFDLWGENREKRLYFDFSFIYCKPYFFTLPNRRTFVVAGIFFLCNKLSNQQKYFSRGMGLLLGKGPCHPPPCTRPSFNDIQTCMHDRQQYASFTGKLQILFPPGKLKFFIFGNFKISTIRIKKNIVIYLFFHPFQTDLRP